MNLNLVKFRPLALVKRMLVPNGRRARRVRFGVFEGLEFAMELQSQTQLYLGLWERETYPFIREALRRSAWCVDVGTGAGELSILFRKAGKSPVIAIDPQETELSLLRANMKLNGLQETDIHVVRGYVGDAEGENHYALDTLGVNPADPGFIKIDVDGAELSVLKSGLGLARSSDSLMLLVETHSASLEESCISLLKSEGYQTTVVPNAWWRLLVPEARPLAHNRWLWATRQKNSSAGN